MKKIILIISFILAFISLRAEEDVQFKYDIVPMKSMGDSVEMMFNFSYSQGKAKFVKESEYFVSNVTVVLSFMSKKDTVSKMWEIKTPALTEDEKINNIFIGSKLVRMPNDNYTVSLIFYDENAQKDYRYTKKIDKYNRKYLSEIVLAYEADKLEIKRKTNNPDFIRGEYYIVPSADEEIHGAKPKIISYIEIQTNDSIKNCQLMSYLYNANKSKVASTYYNIAEGQSFIQIFNADTLPSGLYYIEYTLLNEKNMIIEKVSRKIYIINMMQKPRVDVYYSEDEDFEKSEFSTFSEVQCDKEYTYFKIVASKNELELYDKLTDLKAKQKFYYKFWENRKKNPDDVVNSTRENFKERIETARRLYSEINNDNLSDREKIFIKYGTPIEVETYPAQDGKKAYQSFFYSDLYGGAHFYFVDNKGNGVYRLVHSTMVGEIQNYDWERIFLKDNTQR